jgi:high-affinity Fe2+/Pb2+ permease
VLATLFGWTAPPHPAIFGIGAVGLILLTLMLLRERVAVLPLDPYRKVKR